MKRRAAVALLLASLVAACGGSSGDGVFGELATGDCVREKQFGGLITEDGITKIDCADADFNAADSLKEGTDYRVAVAGTDAEADAGCDGAGPFAIIVRSPNTDLAICFVPAR